MTTSEEQKTSGQPALLENMGAPAKIEAMARISEATMWSKNQNDVYQKMVQTLSHEFTADDATLYLLTSTGESLAEYASCSHHKKPADKPRRISLQTGRIRDVIESRRPIFSDYINPHERDDIPSFASKQGFVCSASVPLLTKDGLIGMYCLSFKHAQNWDEVDAEFLMAIGRMLGVAIRNTQQASNSTELEVLIERKRLSAEIHDNLSQLVSILKLEAEAAKMSIEDGDEDTALKELTRLASTSKQMLKTLREEILYLRAPSYQSQGLVFGIEDCILRFSERWDVAVELRVEGISQPIIVSTNAELQLTRIVHEALSNTFRHADASEVLIVLSGDDKTLIMQISDDGCGFDPGSVPPERMGLTIMKERAGSIGGVLTVDSTENSGTIIRVVVPRDPYPSV